MSKYSNAEVVEEVIGTGGQKFIYPGIYEAITIKGVTSGSSKGGTPFVEVEMYTEEGGEQNSKSFPFYMSDAAEKMSKQKLKHIATKVNTEDAFTNIDGTSLEDYASKLNAIMAGRQLRMKFVNEQYIKEDSGEIKDNAKIGLPDFAEATQPGAHYAPVSKEDSKLVYDKSNRFDNKVIAVAKTNESTLTTGSEEEDPFAV